MTCRNKLVGGNNPFVYANCTDNYFAAGIFDFLVAKFVAVGQDECLLISDYIASNEIFTRKDNDFVADF